MIALATLLVLSGCSGGADSGTPTTGATPTPTTGATPTATPGTTPSVSASSEQVPPGVTANGIENSTALVSAHRRTLVETGFVAVIQRTSRIERGGRTRQFRSVRRHSTESGLSRFYLQARSQTPRGTVETASWGNESVLLLRTRQRNRTRYSSKPRQSFNATEVLTASNIVRRAARMGTYTVSRTEQRNGTTMVRLDATAFAGAADIRPLRGANVTSFEATMMVDSRGVVRALAVRINASTARGKIQLYTAYRITKQGDVRVPRPSWLAEAMRNDTATSPTDQRSRHSGSLTGSTSGGLRRRPSVAP